MWWPQNWSDVINFLGFSEDLWISCCCLIDISGRPVKTRLLRLGVGTHRYHFIQNEYKYKYLHLGTRRYRVLIRVLLCAKRAFVNSQLEGVWRHTAGWGVPHTRRCAATGSRSAWKGSGRRCFPGPWPKFHQGGLSSVRPNRVGPPMAGLCPIKRRHDGLRRCLQPTRPVL